MGITHHILLASSGTAWNNDYRGKQILKLSTDKEEIQKDPLRGINLDILHYEEYCESLQLPHFVIESMKCKNNLKSKKEILQKLSSYFTQWCFFYFTGHGYFKGAMVIQTKQNPDGEPLYVEEVYDLWKNKFQAKDNKCLRFNLDCCYAGKMAARLKNNRSLHKGEIIQINCSSGPSDTSWDLKKFGGILIAKKTLAQIPNYLLANQLKQLKQKFKQKNPVVLQGQNGIWGSLDPLLWY